MILRAWSVLDDCEYARDKLGEKCIDKEWRCHWFATIGLLRSVGYILNNIDGSMSDRHKQVIDNEYLKLKKSKPAPEIYWQFIERERNLIVKEYAFSDVTVAASAVSSIRYFDSETKEIEEIDFGQSVDSFEVYARTIQDGPFKGQRKIDVVDKAILWWKSYLKNIDLELQQP